MQQGVGFFVKIFSSEEYRNEFIKGNLYMNPLKYFIDLEEEHSGNIGDKHEALSAWLQPSGMRMIFKFGDQEFEIPSSDIAAPIAIKRTHFDSVNVLCLMALHSHDISLDGRISAEQVELLKDYFAVPEDVVNLGEYAVVIPNTGLFLEKVQAASQHLVDNGEASEMIAKTVKYYDQSQTLSLTNEEEAIFHKQKSYEHQKEFRISLDRGKGEVSPYVLKVGDLTGVAHPIMTRDINSTFQLVITPDSE
ncbi:hypothetical protein [Pectobacterium zantedeschiae]|uniref:Uncharacterized protein n=1 Tax=Pectobacterium zantedeschiae TaxID=2034769 RepID=A0A9X8JKR1_9GAMM|nr:hypothetical protein [Pectobacterium zantedeschiae]RYC44613.1 hypothetical protein CLR69_06230 [Pectobacterium zantedeschiae]RYC49771.1 hypothetical protein CTN06_02030 [Pectobacterium zantedeschiae]